MDFPFQEDTPVLKPFRELIYDYLRKAIVEGELPQGYQFKDSDLARKFGVSRMPVREALGRLEAEGLIEQTPMKGYRVVNLSLQDIAYIFSIRCALEGLAAAYACRHISEEDLSKLEALIAQGRQLFSGDRSDLDARYQALAREFNHLFIDACQVPRLIHLIWAQRELLERFHVVAKILSHSGESLIDDRADLVSALRARDPESARKIWEDHLRRSMTAYLSVAAPGQDVDFI